MKKKKTERDNVVPVRKKQQEERRRTYMGLCAVAVVVFLVMLIIVLTQCRIKTILVTGNETYTQEEVEEAVRSKALNNTIFYTVIAHFSKNDYLPFIEKSEVTFLGRNVLKVEVSEKLRAGVLQEMSEYFYFDKDGIVREESKTKLSKVPLVTGLKMEDCVLNEQIQPREEDVFPIILKMTQLIIKYDLSVDEIQFNTVSDIRLKTSNLTIKLGTSSEMDAKIAELPAIIEALSGRKGTVNMENYQESNKMITFKDSSASH
jgi:cell division protein FtsQ